MHDNKWQKADFETFKEVLKPVTKNKHVLCSWKIIYASYSNLSKELKMALKFK